MAGGLYCSLILLLEYFTAGGSLVPLLFLGLRAMLYEWTASSFSFTQSPMELPKCVGPLWIAPKPKQKQGLQALLLVVLRFQTWFTVAKWVDYESNGAQRKNPTTYIYQQIRNICIEQQETIKGQCDRERHKVTIRGP